MRNLVATKLTRLNVSPNHADTLNVSKVVFDPVNHRFLCVKGPKDGHMEVVALQDASAPQTLISWTQPGSQHGSAPVSAHFFADTASIVLVMRNGDIVQITLDVEQVQVVGSLEETVEAAEWSPDEELLAISTAKSITLLTRFFDPVTETALSPADLTHSKFVSAGWGKAETQFRGRGAKAAARSKDTEDQGADGPTLDKSPPVHLPDLWSGHTLSWRGDGEYVSLNSTDQSPDGPRRTIRVYSRSGHLDSISVPVETLCPVLAWRPSGSLLAAVQFVPDRESAASSGDSPSLIFFERNGLRRSDFSLRRPSPMCQEVCSLSWSCDSRVLAVLYKSGQIQLWTSSNYRWALKYELSCPNAVSLSWHPEKPLQFLVQFSNHVAVHEFGWLLCSGTTAAPYDYGLTAVVDGPDIKLTPLALANVPPPMSLKVYRPAQESYSTPLHIAFNANSSLLAVLYGRRLVVASWDLTKRPFAEPTTVLDVPLQGSFPKQVVFVGDYVGILSDCGTGCELLQFRIGRDQDTFAATQLQTTSLAYATLLTSTPDLFILAGSTDILYEITPDTSSCQELMRIAGPATLVEVTRRGDQWLAYYVTAKGKLYVNDTMLCMSVTSMLQTSTHILFTTIQNVLQFVQISPDYEQVTVGDTDDERRRDIEAGSLLVSAFPSKTGVVLQAPRGNLETIHPRIMVLGQVRASIEAKRYDQAFANCRLHRVDLNILHDYAPEQMRQQITLFVDQLGSVEYLDQFLSGLKNENVASTMYRDTGEHRPNDNGLTSVNWETKVNDVCDLVISALAHKHDFMQSILTAYACKTPPDLEAALAKVSRGNLSEQAKEHAVQHLCYLQDVDLVYRSALGLYDLKLALLIAQQPQSQKDPKEYLPFLQGLDQDVEARRRFNIDTYLKRFTRALDNLAADPESTTPDELLAYVDVHEIYQHALRLFELDRDMQSRVFTQYAPYLATRNKHAEAGSIYEMLGLHDDAIDQYRYCLAWKPALALCQASFPERLRDEAVAFANLCFDSHQYYDSARIHLDYLNDVSEAVSCLCKGYFFDEAIRTALLRAQPSLVDTVVDSGLTEGFATVSELLADCKGQVKSQVNRLRELRQAKTNDPLTFYGGAEDYDAPDNVSVAASEISTVPSFITRYTGKTSGTAMTGASRRTAKNKRREERKRARGKKGSVYEEEYLINSMGRLIERLDRTRDEAERLIDGLFCRGKRDLAQQVQRGFTEILDEIANVVNEVFTQSLRDRERLDDEGNVYYEPEIAVPVVIAFAKRPHLDF